MNEFWIDDRREHRVVREVMQAVMSSGSAEDISRHFAPGAVFSSRSNAGVIDAPWFGRMEGEYRLASQNEARAFLSELMKRARYISFETRGILVDGESAASRCDWTRQDESDGSLVTGTTMYWFSFTSDGRIRSVETVASVHSVIPARRDLPEAV
ncbi:nuclear transport factor 2 family protein [Aureimonas mangrovi]|uniref:nuclear transport factor 2 family protein n=1 Tax=Aureimonas mangrovi TaxID=2758041 RepID=UPI00163D412D|nr:nuclear transport factor 2 family protein [Aureimonas mangrovi]